MNNLKPSNMEIKVTSCADCPFAEMDDECGIDYWCLHPFSKTLAMNVNTNVYSETLHPSCPLKQQSITVKLENDDILNELRKSEIY